MFWGELMQGCNLCRSTNWETLEQVGDTRVVRCTCGLVFVTPQPPTERLEQAYAEQYYRPWEEQEILRSGIWRRRIKRVEDIVAPPGRLLDLGCGTGDFLCLAREHGWDATGTEFSKHASNLGTSRGLTIVQGEVWDANFSGDTFDVVTCWHVIEHVRDPRRVIIEISRILRPGGWLILATPNVNDHIFKAAYMMARGRRPMLYEPEDREVHLFHFSRESIRSLLTSARLAVVDIGFDREAAAVWGKRAVDHLAYLWFRCTGLHWGMALELRAQKPAMRGETA